MIEYHDIVIHTVRCLICLRVSPRRRHITAAEGLLNHAGVVLSEVTVHVNLLGRDQRQNGSEGES